MKFLQTALLLAICTSGFSQYTFETKKAEKLYYKLDDAYLDYDYNTILDEEDNIKSYFLTKGDTVAANMYSFLAEAYDYELSDYQTALDFYNLELQLRLKIEPDAENKDLLYNMATLQTELGYYGDAEQFLTSIRKSDAKNYGKESAEYFDSSKALIELYLQTEQVGKGLEVTRDIQKVVAKNTVDEGVTYKWTGDIYAIEGSFKKAEKNLTKGVRIFEENGLEATFEYASTLNSLGILYFEKGLLPEAEALFQQTLDILRRIQGENEDVIAGTESNLALVYFNLGDYKKAAELQKNTLEQDKEYYGEDSFTYGLSLLNLGLTFLYDGEYAESEKLHNQALEVFAASAGEESIDYGRVQNNLTLLNTKRGSIEQAIDYGQKSIKTYENSLGEDHPETAFPYFNLANAYLGYEQIDKALPLAQRAYAIRKKSLGEKHPYFARSTNQLAIINWKQGNTKEAMGYYKETFDNYFNQINTFFPVLTEEEKATFYYTKLKPGFEQYISFIEETSSEDKEMIGEIYNYQLALKGLIMYATSKVRESILSSGDEVLIEKYENWVSQKEQLAKLFSVTDISLDKRNKKIDSLTEISNALEEELSKESKVFGKNFANRKLTWQDVQAKLKPGEAAIEVVRYRDFSTDSLGVFTDEVHYAALIVKADTEDYPEMVIMRNGAQMENKYLANYRNAIKYKIAENYSYRLFWRPIANRLGDIKKIYFSPDGVYNQVSIYTLRNPQTKEYLINEIDLSIMTNTKDLVTETEANNGTGSVFFGYPNYNMGSDESVKEKKESGGRGMRSGGTGALERGATIPRGIRGNLVRYMRSFNGLGMLPGTKKEVQLIDSLYASKSIKAEVYLLEEAVENKIKEIKNPSTLHIATHGFFLELDPDDATTDKYVENPLLRSGLVLAGANSFIRTGELDERQGTDDGILTAFEAMNLNLDETDIVVLSACETGLGEIKNGEGVYGLQRAFQIAGADAIIMSIWTVDDAATQELMTNFYEEWLTHGDKRRAFNTAQKRLKEKYDRPYYWGAFIMVGE
ncbi:CHAT domain-containing protein [Ekhidna sp. To15]|uniref:CHAT domain-containing protein n=1 Tax=Ekhidna sp. To15 TaxID=3395267 RepID=UPI003F51B6EA